MQLTPEQEAICASVAAGNNTCVTAFAGCAKTTTIIAAAEATKGGMALAFNVRIKKELEARLPKSFQVLTLNGLGHRALMKALRSSVTLDQDKAFDLVKSTEFRADDFADCKALFEAARRVGIIPKGCPGKGLLPDEEETWIALCDEEEIDYSFIKHARSLLTTSIKMAMKGHIDFTDQIYISSLIFGSFPQSDLVFIDEAQDLSPQNHIMLRKTSRGQLIVVGDPNQAIYAWRGADHLSMENVRKLRNEWTELTLSTTFRCPKSVVLRQHALVPNFQAGPDNLEGSVEFPNSWLPTAKSAVICRNNKPLLSAAFALLKEQIPVNLIGGDIGRQLKRLYNKIDKDRKLTREQAITHLERMLTHEDAGDRVDRIESLIVVLQAHASIDAALEWLTSSRKDAVTLTTGHRAKGLEWDEVFFLDPGLIPSRYATTPAQLTQERNLRYVIETRTKNRLSLVRSEELATGNRRESAPPAATALS